MSLDGHDKLCGYQKSMFPLCIYGGQDAFSSRVNFLRVWTTNNDPQVIGRFYFDYLYEHRVLPKIIRIDKGTETGVMATIHCFLHDRIGDLENPVDSPSTQNRIERWWRELHHRMEKFFKEQLRGLVENGDYDSSSITDRYMLSFVYIPVIQKELDIFRVSVWNTHQTRKQKPKLLPTGIPEHIYSYPEQYAGEKYGLQISEELLQEVAELSGVLGSAEQFLDDAFRQECERHIPNTDEIEAVEAANAYLYLKDNFNENSI
ncbi:uncharacterized protein LOC114537959 [Dendronephthya gigantea]|uniref:uncharacterized protein LOC114537959 n=1 Tax=Dendronephthya gigantea TaxID=151771 RepID=UPI00106BDA29|nr:uncharacterized protein LOC114537959 [Dendronephthya gigantea]